VRREVEQRRISLTSPIRPSLPRMRSRVAEVGKLFSRVNYVTPICEILNLGYAGEDVLLP
jgi:hypothetical protein